MKIVLAILLIANARNILRAAAFILGFCSNVAMKPVIWIASLRRAA